MLWSDAISALARIGRGFVLAALVLSGLANASPHHERDVGGKRSVTVMTWNLYHGFDESPLLTASTPLDVLIAATQLWQDELATNFNERAEAIADEVAAARPDLLGLEEASLFRTQDPGDAIFGGTTPATHVAFDFVEILRKALACRGLHYDVAVSMDLSDIEVPTLLGAYEDVRETDRNVILVRADLPPGQIRVLHTSSADFDHLLEVDVAGTSLSILRGWCSADVQVRGKEFRFVDTHLEDDPFPTIQEAQAEELLEGPLDTNLPVILLGDFNSDAYTGTVTQSYNILLNGDLTDAWTEVNPQDPGLTWGNAADLLNTSVTFSQRLDLILYRGPFQVTSAFRVGESLADRTVSGLWPSDHAGVVAELSMPSPFK